MECRYCQAVNAEEDHRCSRCGRRLRMAPLYTGSSAAAPALRYENESDPTAKATSGAGIAVEPVLPPLTRKPITYQPSLFTSRELPRVVPFETIAPGSVETSPRKPAASKPRPRQRRVIPGQQSLEFAPAAGAGRYARPSEGAIYCDAPVAIAAHRSHGGGYGWQPDRDRAGDFRRGRLSGRWPAGGNAKTLPLVIGIVAVVTFLYRMLWCMANGDSAGMKWARLALVNFDGQKPTRKQRMQRLASGTLSLCAAGLRTIVGAGGRRNAHLARSHFENVPNTVSNNRVIGSLPCGRIGHPCRLAPSVRWSLRSSCGRGSERVALLTEPRPQGSVDHEPRRSTRSYVFTYGVAVTFANTSLVSISPIGLT